MRKLFLNISLKRLSSDARNLLVKEFELEKLFDVKMDA